MFAFIDKGARALCHMQIMMCGINYHKHISIVKPYILQTNQRTGKIYFKLLRYKDESGELIRIDSHTIQAPPPSIVEPYEEMKSAYTQNFTDSMISSDEKRSGPVVQLTPIQKKVSDLLDKGLKPIEIGERLNKSITYIYDLRRVIRAKKGGI